MEIEINVWIYDYLSRKQHNEDTWSHILVITLNTPNQLLIKENISTYIIHQIYGNRKTFLVIYLK